MIIIVILSLPVLLLSQKHDNPLEPAPPPLRQELGVFIGLGGNIQSGSFFSSCNCPEFTDGLGTGFTLGALYDKEFSKNLFGGVALMYDSKSVTASYRQRELIALTSPSSGVTDSVPILFRNKGDLSLSFISLMPYAKWNPTNFMFFRLGFSASYLISSSLKHTKELLQNTAVLKTGEIVSVEILNSGNIAEIRQTKAFASNSFQFSLEPALGFDFQIYDNYFLSPIFQYSIPFTKIADNDNFKVSSWRLFLELRYRFVNEANSKQQPASNVLLHK